MKKFLSLLFSLIFIALGIYLLLQGLHTRALLQPPAQTKQKETPTNQEAQNLGEKYTNPTLKISLILTSPFHLASGIDTTSLTFQAVSYDENLVSPEEIPPGVKLEINAYQKDPALSLLEIAANSVGESGGPSVSFEDTQVGGYAGLLYEKTEGGKSEQTIFVEVKDQIYIIYAWGEEKSFTEFKSQIQRMLDSLTFL